MDKCCIVITLLLVYLIAAVNSKVSLKCKQDNETNDMSDLRLKLPNNTIAKTKSKKEYLCNVKSNENVQTLHCNEQEKYSMPSCSESISTPSATKEKNGKNGEKRYTLTEIILVAFCSLLTGILLTTLVFSLNMKRRKRVSYSKHIKDSQCYSKQQSILDMQFPTESSVVKKHYPNKPRSADSNNENEAEESQAQSFNSIQVDNDQQIYDEIIVNEPRSDRQGHQSSYSRSQHTGNDYHIDQVPNLQRLHAGVKEHFPDADIDGHNYFVLERENVPRESRVRNLGRPETEAEVSDEVKDSTLGTDDKPFRTL